MEDVNSAIRWLKAHAAEYRVDVSRIAIAGESAGGFFEHPERFNMATINRHAANGGGIHFFGVEQLDEAGLAKLHAVAPIAAVHKGMPPFLAIHGTKDDQVSFEQSTEFCDAIRHVGTACDLITIEGGGHGMGGWRAPEMQHWKPETIAWLKKMLNVK
jgi:acetyl esterase